MEHDIKKIGIIGAGVGGLIAAKTLIEEGFDCEVLERKGSLGGVWESGYHSLRLQLPKDSYEFLDWPMPESYPRYPTCDQIVSYLNAYARHFRVIKKIRFNCHVDKMQRASAGNGWTLHCQDTKTGEGYENEYDLVVVCNGLYSTPRVPQFPGQEKFKGRIIHSSLFRDLELAKDSRVAVIGFGKSALDRAEDAAKRADQVTLIFREAHWPVPQRFLGLVDNKWMISRVVSAFLPMYQHPGKWERRLHKYGGGLVWCFWRFLELILRMQFRLKTAGVLPNRRVERDIFTGDFVASPEIYPLIHQGAIRTEQAEVRAFTADGIELRNGVHVEADTVVLGTGWAYDSSLLPDDFESLIDDDGLYLYRHILHPDMPGIVFVGLASTFNNSLTDHLQSRWLVSLLKGQLELPDNALMRREIDEMKEWKRRIMPEQRARGSMLQLHVLHYHDQLLRDLELDHRRKRNALAEWCAPYLPADYREIPSIYVRRKELPEGAGSRPMAEAPLSGEDLSCVDLRRCNLDGEDLSDRIFNAADIRHASLRRANLSGADLSAADLSGADLSSAELINADFSGAIMSRVDLGRAFLIDARLPLAYLNGANLNGAHLSNADLTSARLNRAQIVGADLSGACLKDADLRGANLQNCDLSNADLSGADLSGASLRGATLVSADFSGADITAVEFDETERCKDIRINAAHGNALFKRFAQDQAYVEEYRINKPFRYWLWKYSSNCGRSLAVWVVWCVAIAVGFSLVYQFHLGGSESFVMTELSKEPGYDESDWAPMLYYSVVTFTTLGFGDIVPRTQEAAWWIMAEVVMGYFMLGGLITILATKLARRS